MSKVNQIQTKLKSIDGGKFQKLCDLYLMQNRRYTNLKSIGAVVGKDKTKTGVPDSLITLPDGTFALAHYTTQESGLPGKLKDDFDSSFDENHTGVPVDQIREIIFCHNSSLDTKDELLLLNEGHAKGIAVRFYGLEKIAYDLFDKYPGLAKEFLQVEVDSGQIVTPFDFVSQYAKSAFSTPLDTTFHFREEEIKRVLAALETTDLVLITGGPGVGKTRLMLEAAHRYSKANGDWTVLCIFNRGVDISQDLRVCFKHPGKYLVLVDDANRLSGFEYILQLLHDQNSEISIKIIATVRDYARERVLEHAKPYGGGYEEKLQTLTDDQIRTLVSEEANIHNYHFSDRIVRIAQGNPRLAMMAAKIAVERQTLDSIADVTSLYDEYFGSVRKILEEGGNGWMVKVAGIVSFFRVVDRSNNELVGSIAEAFDIPPSTLWHTVEELARLELFDLYENEVVRFSDQVLATYLFYFSVFKSRVLDFSIFLDSFFSRLHHLFVDALNPVINSLGAQIKDQLRPHIDRKWEALDREGCEEDLIAFIQVFWFVRQTETLLYIRNQIQKMPTEQIDVSALDFKGDGVAKPLPLLDLLGVYYSTEHFSAALELVFDALSRNARCLSNVFRILTRDFSFRPESSLVDFNRQRTVMDRLWIRAEDGQSLLFTRLFLAIAAHYLRTHFEVTESKKMAVAFLRFDLQSTPALASLRQSIWRHVVSLYSLPDWRDAVLDLIYGYSHSGYQVTGSGLLSTDSEIVIPFIVTTLDPGDFKQVPIVQDYLGLLDREGVSYDPGVRERFTNQQSHLSNLFSMDQFHALDRTYEEEEARRDAALRAYVRDYTVEDYTRLLRQLLEIQSNTRDSSKWEFQQGVGRLFTILEERGVDFYAPVVTFYLSLGSPFNLHGRQIVYNLIRLYGIASAYETITSQEFPDRIRWLFDFFASISPDEVMQSHLDQLLSLYRTASPSNLPRDFAFLERYMRFDGRVVVRVVEILLGRMEHEQDRTFAFSFGFLFNGFATTSEKLLSYFGADNIELIKTAYLAGLQVRDHSDHDGMVFSLILDFDRQFLREYITLLVLEAKGRGKVWLGRFDDSKDFSFLWRREDFEAVTRDALEYLFELKREERLYVDGYLEVLFRTRLAGIGDEPKETDITEHQVKMLAGLIAARATEADLMAFVFKAVGGLPGSRRRELLAVFLNHNTRVEDFKRLSLEPMSGGWSGSAVPYYQRKLEFAESLLPLLEGLDFLEHRLHVEKWIEGLQRGIEREKRRDFMDEV